MQQSSNEKISIKIENLSEKFKKKSKFLPMVQESELQELHPIKQSKFKFNVVEKRPCQMVAVPSTPPLLVTKSRSESA